MRFELVDYLHLVYKCIAAPPLSCAMIVDGERRVIDTAIPNFTCKDVWRFSSIGRHPTGVFLEGGAPVRKAYFDAVTRFKTYYTAVQAGDKDVQMLPAEEGTGYKAGRTGMNNQQKLGADLAIDRMVTGGVSAYRVPGYEADDLIWTAYRQLRAAYPDARIDIFTGDMDMLPMVDEKTSVYMRGNRTWAEPLCNSEHCSLDPSTCPKYAEDSCKVRREYKGYFQVTPSNWDEFISYRSAFKGYNIPYNSVYLFKMLRGDTSDNVPMVEKGWGAKKWNGVIEKMIADGVQFDKIFRYDTPWSVIQPVLLTYFKPEVVMFMRLNAEGIRPRSCMGDLINLMPYPNDTWQFDVNACYSALSSGQTYIPHSEGDREKALITHTCLQAGINPTTDLKLATPTVPDLGKFQVSLNQLKINLTTKQVLY